MEDSLTMSEIIARLCQSTQMLCDLYPVDRQTVVELERAASMLRIVQTSLLAQIQSSTTAENEAEIRRLADRAVKLIERIDDFLLRYRNDPTQSNR